ncbi:hypothetical protein HMPREF1569_2261 [Klebsiella oxytoca OK-1]|nr:hypothetical protein [Klebsiella oxytoca]EUC90085.1 hypothetical protein HMPREF1569_2261 [Klebsiella oxytoca OK-1]
MGDGMNISTVNELIQSLESAGELSIKERKYLELAKAYLDVAAENVALKAGIGEAYDKMEQLDDGYFSTDADGEPMDTLITLVDAQAAIQRLAIDIETPVTDAYLAGIKADGVEEFVEKCREKSKQAISSDIRDNWWLAGEHADDFAKQLRGVSK